MRGGGRRKLKRKTAYARPRGRLAMPRGTSGDPLPKNVRHKRTGGFTQRPTTRAAQDTLSNVTSWEAADKTGSGGRTSSDPQGSAF
jgi:hypothetical protein